MSPNYMKKRWLGVPSALPTIRGHPLNIKKRLFAELNHDNKVMTHCIMFFQRCLQAYHMAFGIMKNLWVHLSPIAVLSLKTAV